MTPSENAEDRASTEAAHWLIALEDDPDNADLRARLDAWRAADPANAKAWRDTADIYEMVGKTEPVHRAHWAGRAAERAALRPASGVLPHTYRVRSRLPSRRSMAGAAATVAAAACLAILIVPPALLRLRADYVTTTAELRSVRLADGSRVQLAPDSAIKVAFQDGERRVRLLKGEAYFEVVHEPAHPFRVEAANVQTTDIGTAFDVRLAGDGTDVAVREGRARVEDAAAAPPVAEELGPGQWLRVGRDGQVQSGDEAPDAVAVWRNGQIVAQDRPMAEVVGELRRYYSGLILFTNGGFGRERVTGVYNTADPVAALRAIAGAHGGAVHRISPWLVVISGG